MTKRELREPPLLSDEDNPYKGAMPNKPKGMVYYPEFCFTEGAQAQRDICIKWMKGHCYLKAERELPEPKGESISYDSAKKNITSWFGRNIYSMAQQDMLEEVDGVAYRAVKEFGK